MDSMKLVPYIDDALLSDYAASCARAMPDCTYIGGRGEAAGLRLCRRQIEKCHSILAGRYKDAHDIPAACEWLLDNRYMIQREYPDAFARLKNAPRQRSYRGKLIVTELCRALLQSGQGKLSAARCGLFLSGFQSVTVLQRAELELFPAALRAVIIEALAGCCEKLQSSTAPEALADDFAALFGSLRLLGTMDMESILDKADVSGAVLAKDPGGYYERMDRETKGEYLRALSALAKKQGLQPPLSAGL